MPSRALRRARLLAVAAVVVPAALAAQVRPMSVPAPASPPSASSRAEVRGWYNELQGIARRLQEAHNQAMEDPQLHASQESFMRDVKEAMDRLDPDLRGLAARVRQLEAQVEAARARGDETLLGTILRQFGAIQQRFLRVQGSVLRQPGFAARARALEQQLHRKMLEVEPDTDRLLARSRQLEGLLTRAGVRFGASPPPQRTP